MKTNRWFLVGFVSAWLTCATAQGQQPMPIEPPLPIPAVGEVLPAPAPVAPARGGIVSDWIQYNSGATAVPRDCCFGTPGWLTPLYTELYLRAGPAIPLGGDTLDRQLKVGWTFEGGGRALFFNEPMTSAWAFDLQIMNTNESGGAENTRFPLVAYNAGTKETFGSGGVPGVMVQSSNRTMAGLGLGREWYILTPANSNGCMWRVGADFGGRWGSHELYIVASAPPSHVTDVITAVYATAHTDLEYPTRYGVLSVGLRLEWAYTFSDILQQPSNMQDLSILFNVGVRF